MVAATPELPLALSITFAPETSTISLTLFNQPEPSVAAIPLDLKFKYDPSTPYAPIQEIVDDRNARIKQVSSSARGWGAESRVWTARADLVSFSSTSIALLGSLGSRPFGYQGNVYSQDH